MNKNFQFLMKMSLKIYMNRNYQQYLKESGHRQFDASIKLNNVSTHFNHLIMNILFESFGNTLTQKKNSNLGMNQHLGHNLNSLECRVSEQGINSEYIPSDHSRVGSKLLIQTPILKVKPSVTEKDKFDYRGK